MDKNSSIASSFSDVITLLSELVVFSQYDFNQFLNRFIKIIIKILPADSCLIYFYDQQHKTAMLIGSKKHHEEEIGHVVMHHGEGITTWVAEHKKPVAIEKEAYKDKRFRFFSELPEDKYESFLSVPISNETGVVGVINIQNKKPYAFSKEEIKTLESLVKIIASAFAKIALERKVIHLEDKLEERKVVEKAKGILMRMKQMTENDAFSFLRTEAMAKRKSMKEIAEAILLVWD
ncbi:MAG: ANTAR domain-containing protein [Candidatus Levyibacteriota bacterium]